MMHISNRMNRRPAGARRRLTGALPMAAVFIVCFLTLHARASLPVGLMLSMDFNGIEDGLIPSRSLYPLYVPLGEVGTGTSDSRTILVIEEGQELSLPHSSLFDPDGSEWVAMMRVFALTDGIIMSQSNGEHGYVIYIRDGAVHASVQTGHSALLLRERPENGITQVLNRWTSIEVKITADTAILIIDRAYVALIPLQQPLSAGNCRIRIGDHDELPAPLTRSASISPEGFTGAISSFKILRQ